MNLIGEFYEASFAADYYQLIEEEVIVSKQITVDITNHKFFLASNDIEYAQHCIDGKVDVYFDYDFWEGNTKDIEEFYK